MKTKTIISLLLATITLPVASTIHAQTPDNNTLIIYSSQGRLEIKDTTACRQSNDTEGKISIQCTTQCTQTTDPRDGKIVISC